MSQFFYWLMIYLCSFSLCVLPFQVHANFNETTQNKRVALIIGGAIAAGAIAGGVVASCVSHKSHHKSVKKVGPPGPQGPAGLQGPPGPQGPVGPSPFLADTGQFLTFVLSADFSNNMTPIFPLIATPFVTLPNGITIEGAPLTITGPFIVTFPGIPIFSPVFGSYQAGFNIIQNANDNLLGISVLGTVLATRDGSISTLYQTVFPFAIIGIEGQVSIPFTYDPANIP